LGLGTIKGGASAPPFFMAIFLKKGVDRLFYSVIFILKVEGQLNR